MKTTKFFTAIFTLTFIFFMSVTSIANSYTGTDGGKTSASRISVLKDIISDAAASAAEANEFSNLRFDVNRFINQDLETEMFNELQNQVRFDVNNYSNSTSAESELPVADEFGYLRFDATAYQSNSIAEMPGDEFEYLRFDVDRYTAQNIVSADELPEVR